MKKYLLASALSFLTVTFVSAQEPDQNPQFALSRDKYMRIADSVNQWHGTTFQQTYKAFDWYEAKQERKRERLEFRRNLRMERARHQYYYRPHYYDRNYNSGYRSYYNRHYWLNWCF